MDQDKARGVDPNSMQVDGTHYRTEYQVWDFVENNGLGGLEHAIIKYICRWREKGDGIVDLQKAIHYIDKLIELHLNRYRVAKGVAPISDIKYFCEVQNLPLFEGNVVARISRWSCHEDLVTCRRWICDLIDVATPDNRGV